MALKLPNTLSNLIFSDSQSASLVQQSLTSSVQPVLNFLNQYFTASGSGSSVLLTLTQALTLTKQLLLSAGSLQNPGLAFKDNNTLGFFYDTSNTTIGPRLGIVINSTLVGFISAAGFGLQSPSSASNAATFYNAAGTVLGQINNAGTLTLPSFVSGVGFHAISPPFYFWGNGATTPTAYTNMAMPVVAMAATQTASYTGGGWTATRNGSVTGLSVFFDRSNTVSFTFRLVVNGTATSTLITTTGSNSFQTAKNTAGFTFLQGQSIGIQYATPTAGTPSCVIFATFEVELGA